MQNQLENKSRLIKLTFRYYLNKSKIFKKFFLSINLLDFNSIHSFNWLMVWYASC